MTKVVHLVFARWTVLKQEDERVLIMLKMNHISKEFPGVKALNDVTLTVENGDVLALVGENGAGKSTLMKILSGAYTMDEGELWIDDRQIKNPTPAKMIEEGVAVIYQELMLLPHFTVAENIYNGRYPKNKYGKIDYKKMNGDARDILEKLNLSIDPEEKVENLSVARRQMVEIGKALSKNAKIIVLDEPTAVLADSELEGLFQLVRKLSSEGISFIYISHRLKEVFELCNKVVILKDGCFVESGLVSNYDTDKLVAKMVGRELTDIYPEREHKIGKVVLKLEKISRTGVLNNISLELHEGEILGLAGLAGAGRTEVLRSIIAADPVSSGKIWYMGKEIKFNTIKEALASGIGIVPEERKAEGLQLKQSITFNTSIPALEKYSNKYGKISIKKEKETTKKYIDLLQIRPFNPDILTENMSGGNQQKVVLAKWIAAGCKVLLVDEPTRGVDVGAKREIYEILNSLLADGLAILMVSSELPELIGTCDRICIMNHGRITGELSRDEYNEETIMRYATMEF